MSDATLPTIEGRPARNRFFALPKSWVGWVAAVLGVLLAIHLFSMGPINDAFYAQGGQLSPILDWLSRSSGELFIGLGLSSLVVALVAIIWKKERSWLLLPAVIGGAFVTLFVFGEVFIGHA